MNEDLISREALRHRMYHEAFELDNGMQKWDSGRWIRYKIFENVIDDMPAVEPTLCGYKLDHLILIATVLRRENLPPDRVVEAITDIGRIVRIITDEIAESLRKAVKATDE